MSGIEQMYKPGELARLIGYSESQLKAWRSLGIGPRFTPMSAGLKPRIRYKESDIVAWQQSLQTAAIETAFAEAERVS